MVPCNRTRLLEFSLLALGTKQDSRRARGLKSACLMGAFSANQRKPKNPDGLLTVGQAHGLKGSADSAGVLNTGSNPEGDLTDLAPTIRLSLDLPVAA
jgi:hypothetical protein